MLRCYINISDRFCFNFGKEEFESAYDELEEANEKQFETIEYLKKENRDLEALCEQRKGDLTDMLVSSTILIIFINFFFACYLWICSITHLNFFTRLYAIL